MDLSPGTVIAGRYRVDQRVGAGGMGEVWSGEHLSIGVKVAIKTLLPAGKVSHEVVARFKREAYLLGRIRSEYVARVLDFITDPEFGLVMVMEFIEGDSLAKILSTKRLGVEETIELGADVASALCDLHRAHVVHRDLKPGNIILQPVHGGKRRAVVVDFGVSRMVSGGEDEETITGITRANMAVGTVEYMAPEQVLNFRDVTGGSDCYALGAILFRTVAGRHVYGNVYDNELAHTKLTTDAPALETGRKDRLATGLEDVVARALRRRPSERYARAEEMLSDSSGLRDLARMVELDLSDSHVTTVDVRAVARVHAAHMAQQAAPPSAPVPSGDGDRPAQSAVAVPPAPTSAPAPLPPPPSSAPAFAAPRQPISISANEITPRYVAVPPSRRAGFSRGLVAAALLGALAAGGVVGAVIVQRGGGAAPASASPPPDESARPADEAPPLPRRNSESEREVDLGEIEPAAASAAAPTPITTVAPRPTAPVVVAPPQVRAWEPGGGAAVGGPVPAATTAAPAKPAPPAAAPPKVAAPPANF